LAKAALLCAALVGCRGAQAITPPGVLSISVEKQSAWVRNFNPLAPGEGARFPTRAGVLRAVARLQHVEGGIRALARDGFVWSADHTSLLFPLRAARWSDGARFTAADVVFTFRLLLEHRALDQRNVWDFWLTCAPR
jgi:peptide/nickel transport system substrate-binding protein